MTAKEFVQSHYPKAKVKKNKYRLLALTGEPYGKSYIEYMIVVHGGVKLSYWNSTEKRAWMEAKDEILYKKNELKKQSNSNVIANQLSDI